VCIKRVRLRSAALMGNKATVKEEIEMNIQSN
jgi:hypothetical protein